MSLTPSPNRRTVLPLLCLIAAVIATPAMLAETPSDPAKTAGAIPITIELLDKIDKFTKAVSSDAATTTEWNACSKDPAIPSDFPGAIINPKYPKLAAAFKAAGLTPEYFVKALSVILSTGMMAELGTPVHDKNAEANIAFSKANEDRVTATLNSIKDLDQDEDEKPTSAPSPSPAASP